MEGRSRFPKLLEPGRIGPVVLRNRMIRTGAGTDSAGPGGLVGEKTKAFYGALARGGVGMITVEGLAVNYNLGDYRPGELRLDTDEYIGSFRELTDLIHSYGCPTFLQFGHPGCWHPPTRGIVPIMASPLTRGEIPVPEPPFPESELPRGLTLDEIRTIARLFGETAQRAKSAGFDGVEVNAAGCHLINSFLSRAWNKREDMYGPETLESRGRFLAEIIEEIKRVVGAEYPVIAVINGAEYGIDKGTTVQEAVVFAQIAEKAGADALHVRAFGYGEKSIKQWLENTFYPEPPPVLVPELDWSRRGAGATAPLARIIKRAVGIPVITVGRQDPFLAEQTLREGSADFIAMQRRLLADPELPNKVAAGRPQDIAPCTGCMHCASSVATGGGMVCRINAALGGEEDYLVAPSDDRKKVVVVGGGPAGMEAARVAALRGHNVVLYEKQHRLGGLLPLAALVKGTEIEDLVAVIRYLKGQLRNLGVQVRLGREFTPEMVEKERPDVVIIASGGVPATPSLPGTNGKAVLSGAALHRRLKPLIRWVSPMNLRRLTRFWMPIGRNVVIIGGDIQGCELAEFLTKRGRKVVVTESSAAVCAGLPMIKRVYLLNWLREKGVPLLSNARYESVSRSGLVIREEDGAQRSLPADTIIVATELSPNHALANALAGKVGELYEVGDCRSPGLIIDAIRDGHDAALRIGGGGPTPQPYARARAREVSNHRVEVAS